MYPVSYSDNYSNQPFDVNQYLSVNNSPYHDENPLLDNQNDQLHVFSYPFIADPIPFQQQVTTESITLLAQQALPTMIEAACIQEPREKLRQSGKTGLESKLDNQNHQLRVFSYPFVVDPIPFQQQAATQPTTLLAQQTLGLPTRTEAACIQESPKKRRQSRKNNLEFLNLTTTNFQEMESDDNELFKETLTLTNFLKLTGEKQRRKIISNSLRKPVNKRAKKTPNDLNQRVDKRKKEATHPLERNVKKLTSQAHPLYQMHLPGQSIDLDSQSLAPENAPLLQTALQQENAELWQANQALQQVNATWRQENQALQQENAA